NVSSRVLHQQQPPSPLAMATVDVMSYRTPVPLQWELTRQSEIFLEDGLYPQAYTLLYNVLASGTISSSKAVIPLPQNLAVAATMLVHPKTTTRAQSGYEKEAASAALRFLRLTNSLVSPMDAKFDVAFAFTHFESSRQGRRRQDSPTSFEPVDPDTRPLNTKFNQGSSLWTRAEDFWHAVGWAFNCSVLHPARWERWQVWLQFMCNVLEDDWKERERKYTEARENQKSDSELSEKYGNLETENGRGVDSTESKPRRGRPSKVAPVPIDDDLEIFRESLIFRYITSNTTHGRNRRIMRAIFANGKSSLGEFKEVFADELKTSKEDTQNTKKRAGEVNLDLDQYGDYQDHSDEDEATSDSASRPTRRSKRTRRGTRNAMADPDDDFEMNEIPSSTSQDTTDLSSLGGYTSLALRQQLLSILRRVSEKLPRDFIPLADLYHTFVENIRDLPLPIFQHFVTPSTLPHFRPEAHSTLCELLLYVMRESSAPTSDALCLTQSKLEECFLPYAAATPSVGNNAKISILLEALMTLLYKSKMLSVSEGLRNAVMAGIGRREEATRDRESVEWDYLRESGFRLKFMVEHILP
ncbi:uncharacterized protein N7515_003311, partial [Penicillium bovifimosum]